MDLQAEILLVSSSQTVEDDKKTAQQLARILVSRGISVYERISISFDRERLQKAISTALSRSDLMIVVGGMGGTAGFLAKQVLSEGLHIPLVHNAEALAGIQEYCRRTGTPYYADDVTYASLPQNSRALLPQYGKMPGCFISAGSQHIVMLPETRNEGAAMLEQQVLPQLRISSTTARSSHTLRTYGITEPQVRRMLVDLMGTTNPAITLESFGEELAITVSAQARDAEAAAAITNPVLQTIAERLGDYAYGLNVDSLQLAVVQKMRRKELDVSIAEAGTTGLLGRTLGATEGGQSLVRYHLMAETNETKTRQLGITAKDLRRQGDVSEYTAVAMAHGALIKGRSNLGVGICADIPGAAQREKSKVFIAVCNEKDVYVKKLVISDTRNVSVDDILEATVKRALNMVRLFVDYLPESYHASVPLDVALEGRENITDGQSYEAAESFAFQPEELDTPMAPKSRRQKRKQKKKAKKQKRAGKRKTGKVRRVAFALALMMLIGSAGYLGLYKYRSSQALHMRDDLAGMYEKTSFAGLKSVNPDVVAYMSIDDTGVKYPIVQAQDNSFYHRRDFEGNSNQHGIPYMDYNVDVYKPSSNMVVYGHNMMDGQIFGELLNYRDLEYYKEHPVIEFDTITHLNTARKGSYKIMSVFISNTYLKHGPIFNYHKNIDMNNAEFQTYIDQLELRSLINTTVDTQVGDELITLSTCDYNFSGSRFVVVARRVRPGESAEVDTANAHLNPEPLMPDVWYKSFGGNPPSQDKIDAAGGLDGTKIAATTQRKFLAEKEVDPIAPTNLASEASLTTPTEKVVQLGAEENVDPSAEEEDKAAKEKEAALLEQQKKEAEAKRLQEEAEKKQAEEKLLQQESKIEAQVEIAKAQAAVAEDAYQKASDTQATAEAKKHAETAKEAATKAATASSQAQTFAQEMQSSVTDDLAATAAEYAAAAKKSSDLASAKVASQTSQEAAEDEEDIILGDHDFGTLIVNGKEGDALDIVSRIVQNEIGPSFHPEAIKAQAIAAYSYVAHLNAKGQSASVYLASKADSKIIGLVDEVLGEAVYYGGSIAFTPYHAISAGSTTTSSSVWGGSYPYLVEVDSSVDEQARGYQSTVRMSSDKVSDILFDKLAIDATGNPDSWFEILSYEPGGYVGRMRICGETKSPNTGNTLTGRLVRESVFHFRSAYFSVSYDAGNDEFTFTVYGYGHGVGMSQVGANFYAKDGWSYRQILSHYYPGTSVK